MAISPVRDSIQGYQVLGLALVLLLIGGFGVWAALTPIAGAVVAPASVEVESYAKKVQHLDGGIVAQVLVKNGDRVRAGDVIVRLDDSEARSARDIGQAQFYELTARRARLIAERDNQTVMPAPPGLAGAEGSKEFQSVWEGQLRLLKARHEAKTARKQQLLERIGQLEKAISGQKAQATSKDTQIALVAKELDVLKRLEEDKLVALNRLLALEREAARLEGERGQIVAEMARLGVQIGETRLQLLEVDQTFAAEVLAELRDVEVKLAETAERLLATKVKLGRMTITAPQSGIVHKLVTNTIGGVVGAGEVIAEIVPEEDHLVLGGRLDPAAIDRVSAGQKVVIRFPALDIGTTPELLGEVAMTSPDSRQDGPDRAPYFVVRVALAREEMEKLGGKALRPGMPAELHIQTGERSALSYLLKPFTDQMARAMRER